MALNVQLANVGANAAADGLLALLNGGFLDMYDGVQPVTGDTAIGAQVRLASLQYANPAFGAAVAGVAAIGAPISDTDADASGTATWYRMWKADHVTPVQDGSVGTAGCNINLGTNVIVQHATVSVTTLTYTQQKS
jgi:hypothetical protein